MMNGRNFPIKDDNCIFLQQQCNRLLPLQLVETLQDTTRAHMYRVESSTIHHNCLRLNDQSDQKTRYQIGSSIDVWCNYLQESSTEIANRYVIGALTIVPDFLTETWCTIDYATCSRLWPICLQSNVFVCHWSPYHPVFPGLASCLRRSENRLHLRFACAYERQHK